MSAETKASAGAVQNERRFDTAVLHVAYPQWGSLAVTVLLLAMAGASLLRGDDQTMAGAVIGYVAAFWLPPERLERRTSAEGRK